MFDYMGAFASPLADRQSMDSTNSDYKALQSSGPIGLKPSLSSRLKTFRSKEPGNNASSQRRVCFEINAYTLSELQIATNNFASNRLLGEGSIGRVYKAKPPDSKVLFPQKNFIIAEFLIYCAIPVLTLEFV